mgnify:CR=1 FL=1
MTDAVSLAPLVHFGGEFLNVAANVVITFAVSGLAALAAKYLHIKFTAEQKAAAVRFALGVAQQLWAKAEPSIATASIHVGSPQVADFANAALEQFPAEAKKLGITPEAADLALRQMIVAHIGAMQAAAAATAVPGQK